MYFGFEIHCVSYRKSVQPGDDLPHPARLHKSQGHQTFLEVVLSFIFTIFVYNFLSDLFKQLGLV